MNPQPNHYQRNRFTLVELLVVLVILGVLTALLLPSLLSALEEARLTMCLNNQRQVGILLQTYASDFRVIPAMGSGGGSADYYWYTYYDNGRYVDGIVSGVKQTVGMHVMRCSKSTKETYGMYFPNDGDNDKCEDRTFYKYWENAVPDQHGVPSRFYYFPKNMKYASRVMILGCTSMGGFNPKTKPLDMGGVQFRPLTSPNPAAPSPSPSGLWLVHLNRVGGLFGDGHAASLTPGDLMQNLWNNKRTGMPGDTKRSGIVVWYDEVGTVIDLK